MRVKIYWNFTRKCWSVQSAKTGRVIDHAPELYLTGALFKVSAAGRERVRRERRKNVHAKVTGIRVSGAPDCLTRVRYNPYKDEKFVTEAGNPVDWADFAHFQPDGRVFASKPSKIHARRGQIVKIVSA